MHECLLVFPMLIEIVMCALVMMRRVAVMINGVVMDKDRIVMVEHAVEMVMQRVGRRMVNGQRIVGGLHHVERFAHAARGFCVFDF